MDVGEDGGAAWRDAALLEGEGEIPEVGWDVGGGFLFGEILAEEGEKIGGVVALGGGAFCGGALVESAERRAVRGERHLTPLAVFGVVLAERGWIRFTRHKVSFLCGLRAHRAIWNGWE